MRRRLERQIEAYRDGALSGPRRERIARRLDRDGDGERHLRRTEALGSLVRQAWTEGPPAPAPEYVIAALRPQLAAADAERARRSWRGRLAAFAEHGRRVFRPLPAAALTAAAALALVTLLPTGSPHTPGLNPGGVAQTAPSAVLAQPADFAALNVPDTIYDLSQGEDTELWFFEGGDGATVIWLLGNHPDADQLSWLGSEGWA